MTSFHSSNCFYKKNTRHCRSTKGERVAPCLWAVQLEGFLDKIGRVGSRDAVKNNFKNEIGRFLMIGLKLLGTR